jgi:hypothetical protein
MKRPLGEYIILASLVVSLAFLGHLVFFGSWHFSGIRYLATIQIVLFVGLGAFALWLLALKRIVGAVLCVAFYGIQLFSITLSSGWKIDFHSLPTLFFRLNGDKQALINLNTVSLVFFLLSLGLLSSYRERLKT